MVLSCVKQMRWYRYKVWKGLDILLYVIFIVQLLLFLIFFSFLFHSSALVEGRRCTCIYVQILCHIYPLIALLVVSAMII
jgi:hypothetical protein